jgi:transposase
MPNRTELAHFVPRDLIEWRRLRAWFLFLQGWMQVKIAQALGVTQGAVSQWLKRARLGGVEALRRGKAKGGIPRLSPQHKAQIPSLLARGPQAYGFAGDLWTCERIAEVIRREFGVRYDPSHISRLMRQCRWSVQKPERRAAQRDEEAIATWRTERWPALKKSPTRRA